MAIKKKAEEHENHERWLVSYADFITLLFAFFVVMYSSSSRDLEKVKQLSVALVKSFGSHESGPMEKQNGQPLVDREATRPAPVTNMFSYGPGEGMGEEISPEDMFKESNPLFQLKGRVDGILRSHGALGAFQTKIEVIGLRITCNEDRVFTKTGEIKENQRQALLEIVREIRGVKHKLEIEAFAAPTARLTTKASMQMASLYAAELEHFLETDGKIAEDQIETVTRSLSSAGFTRAEDLDDGVAVDIVVTRKVAQD